MLESWLAEIERWGGNPWLSVEPLKWTSLFACLVAGGVIGLERQWQGKPIGIRTSVLICLGTYIFVAIGAANLSDGADSTRVIGQVINGIGFLGAGVMLTRQGVVIGATSAASIWVLAAIGVVIGTGAPLLGVKLAVLAVILLVGVNALEERWVWLQEGIQPRPRKPPADTEPKTTSDPEDNSH